MTQRSGSVPMVTNKGGSPKAGGSSSIKFSGGGSSSTARDKGAGMPSPKAAQTPKALQAERKSDDRAAKRGGKNGPNK